MPLMIPHWADYLTPEEFLRDMRHTIPPSIANKVQNPMDFEGPRSYRDHVIGVLKQSGYEIE